MAKRLGVVGYTSEWAAMMLYEALFRYTLSDKFEIVAISGREDSGKEAMARLLEKGAERNNALAKKLRSGDQWRIGKNLAFVRNASTLVEMMDAGFVQYFKLGEDGKLPEGFYSPNDKPLDAVGIFTANPYHLSPLEDAINHNVHVLVEKPTVPLIDKNGIANRDDLDRLTQLEDGKAAGVITQDSEHYSAKTASKALFSNIWDMANKYGRITGIKGEILEIDDPKNPRTQALLRQKNRTGLLTDTGVHLFSIITNLGYDIGKINSAEYDIYPGYDVETYAHVNFEVTNRMFNDSIDCDFTVAKFVDRLKGQKKRIKESKKIEISFENGYNVTINFSEGKVGSSDGKHNYFTNRPTFEYNTILTDFDNAIDRGRDPRTSVKNSIKNLGAIHQTLESYPVTKNPARVYKR